MQPKTSVLIEALKREIKEELDADITVGDLLDTVEWDYPTFHLTMHCYVCSLESVKWLPADLALLEKIARRL